MRAKGVHRGDHIGVILPNSIEYVALMLAVADMGAVMVPLDPSLPVPAIDRAFCATDVKHLVATSRILAELHRAPSAGSTCAEGLRLALDGECPGAISLKSLLDAHTGDTDPLHASEADDPYILTMTSGSTGD